MLGRGIGGVQSFLFPFPGVRPLGFKRILICLSLGENLPSGTLDGLTSEL